MTYKICKFSDIGIRPIGDPIESVNKIEDAEDIIMDTIEASERNGERMIRLCVVKDDCWNLTRQWGKPDLPRKDYKCYSNENIKLTAPLKMGETLQDRIKDMEIITGAVIIE